MNGLLLQKIREKLHLVAIITPARVESEAALVHDRS